MRRILDSLRTAVSLLCNLRPHDFNAARQWMALSYPQASWPARGIRFIRWVVPTVLRRIPEAEGQASLAPAVSRTPIWLAEDNPLANYPFAGNRDVQMPSAVDVVVIGAGFTGASIAYHASRQGQRRWVVIEQDDPASGASGRNAGVVVMGRYFHKVHSSVLKYLVRCRPDLTPEQQDKLAGQFAARYVQAAYANADMIERTIREEEFDCGYQRRGWIQARGRDDQDSLRQSVSMSHEAGFGDWQMLTPQQVADKSGMRVASNAGYSVRAATFHPAKWVWSLLSTALKEPNIDLFTRTQVLRIEHENGKYLVRTRRGVIQADCVVNATESYTALLHPQFRHRLVPFQTQAAFAEGAPESMKAGVAISSPNGFFSRQLHGMLVGSDESRVPHRKAGANRPSRFITRFPPRRDARVLRVISRAHHPRMERHARVYGGRVSRRRGIRRQAPVSDWWNVWLGYRDFLQRRTARRFRNPRYRRPESVSHRVFFPDENTRTEEPQIAGYRDVTGVERQRPLPAHSMLAARELHSMMA